MKAAAALTLRPHWAWFVVNGYKDIENRSWRSPAVRSHLDSCEFQWRDQDPSTNTS